MLLCLQDRKPKRKQQNLNFVLANHNLLDRKPRKAKQARKLPNKMPVLHPTRPATKAKINQNPETREQIALKVDRNNARHFQPEM